MSSFTIIIIIVVVVVVFFFIITSSNIIIRRHGENMKPIYKRKSRDYESWAQGQGQEGRAASQLLSFRMQRG
jgi:NADH:ubiquinone oxidoreductase subunit 3 (subunit A)